MATNTDTAKMSRSGHFSETKGCKVIRMRMRNSLREAAAGWWPSFFYPFFYPNFFFSTQLFLMRMRMRNSLREAAAGWWPRFFLTLTFFDPNFFSTQLFFWWGWGWETVEGGCCWLVAKCHARLVLSLRCTSACSWSWTWWRWWWWLWWRWGCGKWFNMHKSLACWRYWATTLVTMWSARTDGIGCVCLTFLHCVFLDVSLDWLFPTVYKQHL